MSPLNRSRIPARNQPTGWLKFSCLSLVALGFGCTHPYSVEDVGQLTQPSIPMPQAESTIPETVKIASFLPKETDDKLLTQATYTVVVTAVPVTEVLFALARDAHLNIDIVPGIVGSVTLNAINQTLPKILERIAHQSNIRYRIMDNVLSVEPDLPYRHNYRVDYVSTARTMESEVSIATTVASNVTSASSSAPTISNSSSVKLGTASNIDFWKNLISNLNEIVGHKQQNELNKGDDSKEGDAKDETKKIIWNEATGIISVLASAREHKDVQEFIDRVMYSAQRQVLIEATVAEVRLSDQYQSGIDWSLVKRDGTQDMGNFSSLIAKRLESAPLSILTLNRTKVPFLSDVLGHRDVAATLRLLSQFGQTKVLSSPRITVLNNQTAILRVTTNEVYFQIRVSEATYNENGTMRTSPSSETQIRTVPLGFIMQVTPQISESNVITLNIRPTIQRVDKWVDNPDPNLRVNLPVNYSFVPPQIPVVKVQEMDSVLRVPNGQVAVMGGLMENSRAKSEDGIPVISEIPLIGELFNYRDQKSTKSELVVFLRPIISAEPRHLLNPHDSQLYSGRDTPLDNVRNRDLSAL